MSAASTRNETSAPDLSVVLVTFNRCDILRRTLLLYNDQAEVEGRFEVVLVDDGSTDGTAAMITALRPALRYPLTVIQLASNDGPAKSRNEAIAAARGQVIVLSCDDILPVPDFLAEHWAWHAERYPADDVAVLGRIVWHPELDITALMRWLEASGDQFAYADLEHGQRVPHSRFYTSNLSLKRRFLERAGERMDERLHYGFEDTEWGQRLAAKGLTIRYNAQAVGSHLHPTTLASALRRIRAVGPSAMVLRSVNPAEFERVTNGLFTPGKRWKRAAGSLILHPVLARAVYVPLARLCERRLAADRVFALAFMSAMKAGLRDAGLRW